MTDSMKLDPMVGRSASMGESASAGRRSRSLGSPVVPTLILLALAFPFLINLGASSLWDANEAFYAQTPIEMMETGNYLAPQFNQQVRAQKPPLTYWLVLLSYKAAGISESAVRLPGGLAAIGTLLLAYAMARLIFGPRSAIFAAAIAATTPRMFVLARKLPIDILLLFWLVGTAYFIMRGIKGNSTASWLLAGLFAGMGFLTKGPVAMVIPVLALAAWSLWFRSRAIFSVRLLAGILIFVAVVAPWYVAVYRLHGWTYIATFFLKDNLGRFASETFGPSRSPLFYFSTYAVDFFPWSFLTPVAALLLWSHRKSLHSANPLAYGFPLLWCAVVFVLFSFSKNKQEYYIAPIYPVAAVLLAGVLERVLDSRDRAERKVVVGVWKWTIAMIAAVFVSASALWIYVSRSVLPDLSGTLRYVPSAILAAAAVILFWDHVRTAIARSLLSLAAPIWLILLLSAVFYLPALEPYRPVKDLCKVIERYIAPGDEAGYFRAAVPSMVYYLRRPIFEEFDTDAMIRKFQSPKRIFCILVRRDYGELAGARGLVLHVLERRPRLMTQLRYLWDKDASAEQELMLVSNGSLLKTAAFEGRGSE